MQYECSQSSAAAGLERCGNRQKRELATPSSKSPASSIPVIRTIMRAYMRECIDVTRCFQPIPIFLRYLFSDCSSTQQQDHGDSTKPTHHVIVWTWSPLRSLADRVRHCKGLYPRENPNSFHSSLHSETWKSRWKRRRNRGRTVSCIPCVQRSVMTSCRISGTTVCLGLSAYSYSLYRKAPVKKTGDRRFDLAMCIGFGLLGLYRGFIY